MEKITKILFILSLFVFPMVGHGRPKIVTTTTNLESLVKMIVGDKTEVFSMCKGTQDPHHLAARPSYMIEVSRADLLVSIGLALEVGWLPLIIRGARNPKVREGKQGSFVAGEFAQVLNKVQVSVSRADGDIHTEGNPHILLSPANALKVAKHLKERLAELYPENKAVFVENFKKFSQKMNSKIKIWKRKVKRGLKVITYHKTLTYFYHFFGIEDVATLEPKPGIPPTAGHILRVMKTARQQGVRLALVENYFDPTIANRVASRVNGLRVKVIPVAVDGEGGISDLFDLYDRLVMSVL